MVRYNRSCDGQGGKRSGFFEKTPLFLEIVTTEKSKVDPTGTLFNPRLGHEVSGIWHEMIYDLDD